MPASPVNLHLCMYLFIIFYQGTKVSCSDGKSSSNPNAHTHLHKHTHTAHISISCKLLELQALAISPSWDTCLCMGRGEWPWGNDEEEIDSSYKGRISWGCQMWKQMNGPCLSQLSCGLYPPFTLGTS